MVLLTTANKPGTINKPDTINNSTALIELGIQAPQPPTTTGVLPAAFPAQRLNHRPWARRVRNRVALMDVCMVYLAIMVAFFARIGIADVTENMDWRLVANSYALTSISLLIIWIGALAASGAWDIRVMGSGSTEYSKIAYSTFAVFALLAIFAYVSNWPVGRSFVAVALPFGLVALTWGRWFLRGMLRRERAIGGAMARTVVVGASAAANQVVSQLTNASSAGFEVDAVCFTNSGADLFGENLTHQYVLDSLDQVPQYVIAESIDAVVVVGSDELTPKALKQLAWDLEPTGADLILAPGLTDVAGPRLQTRVIPGMPLLQVEPPGYTSNQQKAKRCFDLIVGSLLLVVLAIPLLVTALLIKITSPGPVFFRQTRIGADGQPFEVFKFRSMCVGAEKRLEEVLGGEVGLFYKPKNDPRITPIGNIIRRYSIDELPQIFNVLSGQMSLVGPRPQILAEVEQYDAATGRRLLVKPGMTGLWQVSGRNNLSVEESVRLDLYYVENWTMFEDFAILAKTAKAVVGQDGAS
ncbi:MAG: sugar transferase [Cellulomonadaceae bacterium]|jgi:exopolysaccharide biosynthesis polyprenyl glycosylphosphotransferase|nr:sugar transferase [Cellulomonadaceae bacterium]